MSGVYTIRIRVTCSVLEKSPDAICRSNVFGACQHGFIVKGDAEIHRGNITHEKLGALFLIDIHTELHNAECHAGALGPAGEFPLVGVGEQFAEPALWLLVIQTRNGSMLEAVEMATCSINVRECGTLLEYVEQEELLYVYESPQ